MNQLEREQAAFSPDEQLAAYGYSHLDVIAPINPDGGVGGQLARYETSTELTLVDLRERFPDDDRGHRVAGARKRVAVYHHDAVTYSGTTIEDDLARLDVIHRFHIDKGWGGTGYHFAIPPVTECVYILGVLEESRAHISTYARAANPELWGDDLPNAAAIGIVWLGNFADRRDDETGTLVEAPDDRPTERALARYEQLVTWLPTVLDRDIVAVPHKGAHPGHTACPGDWIHRTAEDRFRPVERRSDVDQALAIIGAVETRLLATRGDLQRIMSDLGDLAVSIGDKLREVADGYEQHEIDLRRVANRLEAARRLLTGRGE